MKVKKLIQILSGLNPEAEVEIYKVHAWEGGVGAGPEKMEPEDVKEFSGKVTIIGGSCG